LATKNIGQDFATAKACFNKLLHPAINANFLLIFCATYGRSALVEKTSDLNTVFLLPLKDHKKNSRFSISFKLFEKKPFLILNENSFKSQFSSPQTFIIEYFTLI